MTEKFKTTFGSSRVIEGSFVGGQIAVTMTAIGPAWSHDRAVSIKGSPGAWRAFARWLLDPEGDPTADKPLDKTDAAYLLGRANYAADMDIDAVPFHAENTAYGLWKAGWHDAEADACERQGLRAAEDAGR